MCSRTTPLTRKTADYGVLVLCASAGGQAAQERRRESIAEALRPEASFTQRVVRAAASRGKGRVEIEADASARRSTADLRATRKEALLAAPCRSGYWPL